MTNNNNIHRKNVVRWFKKYLYENKESEGKSSEQIRDDAEMQMAMVLAPIDEAYRRGEISIEEARRQIYHTGIKFLHEQIKEIEEKIEVLLVWGRADSKDPKVIERQRKDMERQRREDPVIIKLQAQIDDRKK